MKATLKHFAYSDEKERDEVVQGVFRNSTKKVKYADTGYRVELNVELTEEEKAIVEHYGLKDLVLEDDPSFTPEQIAAASASLTGAFRWHERNEDWVRDFVAEGAQGMRAKRRQVKLGEYLRTPYEKSFATAADAAEYYDKLRIRIVPTIGSVIKANRERPAEVEFEF